MMITLKNFDPSIIPQLTPIMKRAFDEDTRLHLKEPSGGPEGYEDGSFLKKWFLHPGASAYSVYDGATLIGGVNLWIREDRHNILGCIFLDPDHENRGYGTKVWALIEKRYPDTLVWKTETPIFSRRNHAFYINKCGFKCVRIINPRDERNGFFMLEKDMRKTSL
ncbi:MAG: GNAT family N-acetyltransferase [Bacilli bacterium]